MADADLLHHIALRDGPEPGACTILLKDAFLNYSLADQLKRGLKDVCRERLDAGVRDFVVDLAAVTVMDSCGLSVLISLKKMLEAESARIRLSSLSPMIVRLFSITKLDKAFEIAPSGRGPVAASA